MLVKYIGREQVKNINDGVIRYSFIKENNYINEIPTEFYLKVAVSNPGKFVPIVDPGDIQAYKDEKAEKAEAEKVAEQKADEEAVEEAEKAVDEAEEAEEFKETQKAKKGSKKK